MSIVLADCRRFTKKPIPRYYRLIEHFRDLTGIPLVRNTSFSENEPVICYPEEALDCFLRTQMDILVLRNFWIARDQELAGSIFNLFFGQTF
jgi:predicted NodU family carbamoyl transferase